MGISELLHKKEKNAVNDDINKLLEEFNVEGLEEVLIEINNLKTTEIYDKLLNAFQNKEKINSHSLKLNCTPFQISARETLKPRQTWPLVESVDFLRFSLIYQFLEILLFINVSRTLTSEDMSDIYLSGLDEKILLNLERFDTPKTVEIPRNFFNELKKVKWGTKKDKEFFLKINKVRTEIIYGIVGSFQIIRLPGTEDNLIFLLAACSAVKKNNDIRYQDVIIAYKTYIKLLKTDITKYIDNPEF